MKPKTKLYCCPKCSKKYGSVGWMKRHLVQKNHGITFLTFYSYDTIKEMDYRLAQLEHKLDNLDFKNIVVESSDAIISSIKKKIPTKKVKSKDQAKYNISVSQLNIIFKMVSTNESEHNVKPSEVASKNEESYKILEPTIKN